MRDFLVGFSGPSVAVVVCGLAARVPVSPVPTIKLPFAVPRLKVPALRLTPPRALIVIL